MALDMLDEVRGDWELPDLPVVADAGYGDATGFREGLTERGLTYAVAVKATTTAHPGDATPQRPPYSGQGRPPVSAYPHPHTTLRELARTAGQTATRTVTWRQGSKTTKRNPNAETRSQFLALRVRPANRHIRRNADGSLPDCRLLVEWPPDSAEPTDYWLSTLPADTPLRELVRIAKIRWRVEHDYRELKDGLGPGPLRGPQLPRPAPPRHPRLPRPSLLHNAQARPKSPCTGLTLYAVLRELQALLATWTGACSICGQPAPRPDPHRT
ncbi:transposase [Streptomyces sp. NBC_01754]|uniref:transposase n=1 Tax=Streptomyces sp. NBC_01754 TaxID=2975930 RepID=UPI003FA3C5E4